MKTIRSFLALAPLIVAGTVSAEVRMIPQDSGVDVRLRGISAVSSDVAWASGREGTVLRTTDGGKHWQTIKVPGAGALDFRDVEGFDADSAVVLSIGPGDASRVYRTADGGTTWILSLQNKDPRAFFDCMAFDGERGWMLGDPVDSRFQIRVTYDGGRDWHLLQADMPEARPEEAAFAASGTCISRTPWGEVLAVTGGGAARVLLGDSGERHWWAYPSGMPHRIPAAGIFSATRMGEDLLLVGGDFERESVSGGAARVRFVDGHGLGIEPMPAPRAYRSGAACTQSVEPYCIAVGPAGADGWDGSRWVPLPGDGYDAIDLVGNVGWASGDAGRIARIELSNGSGD